MARFRTRIEVSARIRREYNLRGQTHYPTTDLYELENTEWAWCFEWLTEHSPDGFGVTTASLPTVAGQSWVALPSDFSDLGGLRNLRRLAEGRYEPITRSSRSRENDLDPSGDTRRVPGVYWLEGPSSSAPTVSRLELRPIPAGIEDLEITYVQQAPQWVDDATQIDLLTEHVERLFCSMVAFKALGTGDRINYQKIQQQMIRELSNLGNLRGRRDSNEPNWVSLHQQRSSGRYRL